MVDRWRTHTTAASFCLLLVSTALGVSAQTSSDARPLAIRGAERSAPVTPFVWNGDTRDLPAPPQWRPGDPVKEIPRRAYPRPGEQPIPYYQTGLDPLVALQWDYLAGRSARQFDLPSRNFPGQGYSGVNPPDTVGDVGPNHYVQMINGGGGALVAIYDKSEPTPNLLSSFTLDSLGSGACASGRGDPIVLYDRLADRWMLSEFSFSGNNLCVYISQTPDPTGGYYAYGFAAPSFPDYPKYGVWPTDANGGQGSYVVTANDGGPGVYALDRGAMLVGAASTYQRLTIPPLSGFAFQAPTPADMDGPQPPAAATPAIIMRHRDTENHSGPAAPGDLLELWEFQVDWAQPANTTLFTRPSIDVAEFDSALCGLTAFFCFPQPGSSTTLDPLREVIMNRLQYMNHGDRETLVGNFVVDVDGADLGGLRWFELERSGGGWTLKQEGTYSIDDDNRFMAASSMDQSGNIAIAYNITSSATFPSLRYTGRLDDDPPGVMTQPETVIHAGASPNSSNRYGDYSGMNLDPADDCTFWFTGMDNLTTSWRTQIASFRFDACGCELLPDPPLIDAFANGDNRIDLGWNDSSLETVVEYVVQRSRTPGGPYQTIAVVPDDSPGVANGPGYTYADIGVSGDITYYYVVVASDGEACKSDPTNEVSATATGPCTLPPIFAGLAAATTPFSAICSIDLSWNAAVSECGGQIEYTLWRSQDAEFDPATTLPLAEGLTGTSFLDLDTLVSDETYYYVVRATDLSNGKQEQNLVRLDARPQGELTTGVWFDDAGDSAPAKMILDSPWNVDPDEGNFGPNVYKTGSYADLICAALETPELRLGNGSQLTFHSKYDIEPSWDKGEVQISTDGGETWERVDVAYPGNSTNTSDNCGLPQGTYFTGSGLSWATYGADLSAYAEQFVRIRFVLSTDTSVNRTGWWIDDIMITQVDVPGTCATGSTCPANPLVSVAPEGLLDVCPGATELTTQVTGGSAPFSYQWTRDGVDVPGATETSWTPQDEGLHTYNCKVQSASCDEPAFAARGASLNATATPSFGGLTAVDDAQGADCSITLDWEPAGTFCDGPIHYFVYRDTAPGVSADPAKIVASNLTATGHVDVGGLVEGQTYYYLVRALDRSTARFDGNAVEGQATPTGPGTGVYSLFFEDFTDANALADWPSSVSPATRTCGLWERSSSAALRPIGGAGFFATSNGSVCGNQKTATTLESPAIDLGFGGVDKVTLTLDLYYNHLDGTDTAAIDGWDGATWQPIWSSPAADVNAELTFDVTSIAAGNPAFRIRFVYDDIDQWLSVDNVDLTVDVANACATSFGPSPVPDGRDQTAPLRGARLSAAGDQIELTWDTASCAAADYSLLYGNLADVSSYALAGSQCGLGTSGSFVWNGVPAGDLYFLLVGSDAAGSESSWGTDGLHGERNGPVASGECGATVKDLSGTCP
ncbi:MAG TPA: choice-of-anchor J domain-containing protein [Candidatus Polarisedimenticolaceae bacterium]|nr:choice-of-anchor J domain-containing protein [Candidatus Polarisedimenticolaceae bacterium]